MKKIISIILIVLLFMSFGFSTSYKLDEDRERFMELASEYQHIGLRTNNIRHEYANTRSNQATLVYMMAIYEEEKEQTRLLEELLYSINKNNSNIDMQDVEDIIK